MSRLIARSIFQRGGLLACAALALLTLNFPAFAQNPKYKTVGKARFCDASIVYGPNRLGASAIAPNGMKVILFNPEIMATLPFLDEFVFAHECGHHALNHATPQGSLRDDLPFKTKELNADCWASKALTKAGLQNVVRDQIRIFRDPATPASAPRYPTYAERADKLESCAAAATN